MIPATETARLTDETGSVMAWSLHCQYIAIKVLVKDSSLMHSGWRGELSKMEEQSEALVAALSAADETTCTFPRIQNTANAFIIGTARTREFKLHAKT